MLNEFSWALGINSNLHRGAQAHALAKYDDHYAIIYEWKEGVQIFPDSKLPLSLSPEAKADAIENIKNHIDDFLSAGIAPKDFQIQISERGEITLIDTEKFLFMDPADRPYYEKILQEKLEGFIATIQSTPSK